MTYPGDAADAGGERSASASVFREAADLAKSEVALLRVEMARNVRRFRNGVAWMILALCLGVLTMLLLPVVAILGLMHFHFGPFAASAIVAGALGAGTVASVVLARRRLPLRRLIPSETIGSLRADVRAIWDAAVTHPADGGAAPVED
jgi:hypothetical protein